MFYLIPLAVSVVVFFIGIALMRLMDARGLGEVMFDFSVVFFVTFFAIGVIHQLGSYTFQLNSYEETTRLARVADIFEEKSHNLTAQFAQYLAMQYPEHEREIFREIGPDGINVYLARYPELRASETVMALVGQIRSLEDDIYETRIKLEKECKNIRYRPQSPWVLISLPTAPEKIGEMCTT